MPDIDQELSWARKLYQARNALARSGQRSLATERSVILRDIRSTRRSLASACKAKNIPEAMDWLRRLIQLRAEQTAITLEQLRDTYGGLDDEAMVAYSRQYANDCATITRATHSLLNRS